MLFTRQSLFTAAVALLLFTAPLNCTLTIWKPNSLAQRFTTNQINMTISVIGKAPMGHTIIGKLVAANPINACSDLLNVRNKTSLQSEIVLVERGNCSFA
jgi:hypothetical protein